MLKILSLPIVYLLSSFAYAEMYKSVDKDGNVVYSDEETPDATIVDPPSMNTIQMPEGLPEKEDEPEPEPDTSYKTFKITSPNNDATVRENSGNVTIVLKVDPELNTEQGHGIDVLIDGKAVVKKTSSTSVTVNNIDRGSHTITAVVRNKKGKTLIKSQAVRFHLLRHSVLHDPGGIKQTGPLNAGGQRIVPGPQGTSFSPGPVVTVPPASSQPIIIR